MTWELFCLCGLVDLAVGFSFGGVVSVVYVLSVVWVLFCLCGLVDGGVGLFLRRCWLACVGCFGDLVAGLFL